MKQKQNKWLDNFGKADNANESNVSLPEDFNGLSYNTTGRNYSPAWGGSFENGGYIPIAQDGIMQDATRVDNNAADRIWGIQRQIDSEKLNRDDFQEKYGMPLHQFKMRDSNYASAFQRQMDQRRQQDPNYGEINLPQTDVRSKIYQGNPNLAFLPGTSEGQSRAALEDAFLATTTLSAPLLPVNTAKLGQFSKLVGNYLTTQTPLKNTYKLNPFALKRDDVEFLYRWQADNVPSSLNMRLLDDKYTGRWYESKPTPEYMRIRPGSGQIQTAVVKKGTANIPEEVIRTAKESQAPTERMLPDNVGFNIKRVEKNPFDNIDVMDDNFKNVSIKARDLFKSTNPKPHWLEGYKQIEIPKKELGGSIPGTTGFTYARTGSTPSEGKYAKKTLPSAQTGITSPLLLTSKILEYFNPRKETIEEEIVPIAEQPAEYKKGLTNELLRRQAYKESTFNPVAVSPKGYKGLAQVGEDVIKDYMRKKEKKKLDPFKPEEALELQRFAMEDLYNSSFIDKPNQSDSVRIAKTLAAYNWGRGNLFDYLGQQKSKGIDIYNSYDWLKDLPKETSDYVNKILLQEDDSFNKNYQKAITNPKYKDISSMYEQKEYGGMIPVAQNGREMQFYQEGLDWKPKSMQYGGIEQISINDPRYPELYKNRQIGSWSPQHQAFNLPDLPEFTVTGKDESLKEAMYQGSNRFLNNALGVLGSSQTVPMELLTGKQQTPSEAWGFDTTNKPWYHPKSISNFAMDAVLDPTNLIGAGVVDDLTRGAIRQNLKNVRMSVPSEIAQGVQENNLGSIYTLNPITAFGNLGDYSYYRKIGSGKGIKDLIDSGTIRSGGGYDAPYFSPNTTWEGYRGTFAVGLNPSQIKGLQMINKNKGGLQRGFKASMDEIPLSEEATGVFRRFPFSSAYTDIPVSSVLDPSKRTLREKILLNPTLSNIQHGSEEALRYGIKGSIAQYIGNELYGSEKDPKPFGTPILLPVVSHLKEDFMSSKQANQYKKGGQIIKDNKGYWNPDNWGKPVEIDSNEITMEGVYEPLLGISNEGDVQYMEPGNNYKFKGERVLEIPIARLGINDLDAQPKKKLNQLLNFTNNPDNTNWLDKYQ